ncbi:MAG: hypothetical protein ACD_75C00803G0001 [uncultured bacterium]|nr:MAG: hypothetical protein ACD_75C00803G0001 [uncultured bacterium]
MLFMIRVRPGGDEGLSGISEMSGVVMVNAGRLMRNREQTMVSERYLPNFRKDVKSEKGR